MNSHGWYTRDAESSGVPQPTQDIHGRSDPSYPPLEVNGYTQPVREAPTMCSIVQPPTLASEPSTALVVTAPSGAVLYGTAHASYSTYSIGDSSTNMVAGNNDGNVASIAAPAAAQRPTAYTSPTLLYGADANAGMPCTHSTQLSYAPAPPFSGTPMEPPAVPMRSPTASSSRSASGAVRHRGRTGRMISRAREHIDGFRERPGTAEIHWSEVDAEGTWVLMLVRASERGYEG